MSKIKPQPQDTQPASKKRTAWSREKASALRKASSQRTRGDCNCNCACK